MESSKDILLSLENGIRTITFNRPQKKNSLTPQMYDLITNTLNADAKNDKVVLTILTGQGDYYSSGNDFSNISFENLDASWEIIYNFVNAFIEYPKLLFAVVNGPAIGIAVTTLALCDVVYASDKATFHTPFIKLAVCAEGCSSYMFPRIMGRSTASEMLLLGRKLDAQEAFRVNLVSQVVPHSELNQLIGSLREYGNLPVNSVKTTKKLIINKRLKNILRDTNKTEINTLKECVQSEEFSNALLTFMSKRNKSKL